MTEDIVQYRVYAHTTKDSMYEAARDAGISDVEIQANPNLIYVGYEVTGTVTFNRKTGEVKEEWRG